MTDSMKLKELHGLMDVQELRKLDSGERNRYNELTMWYEVEYAPVAAYTGPNELY